MDKETDKNNGHSGKIYNSATANVGEQTVKTVEQTLEEVAGTAKKYGGPRAAEAVAVATTIAAGVLGGIMLAEVAKGLRRKPAPQAPETIEEEALRRASSILSSRMEDVRDQKVAELVAKLLNKQQ